RRTSRDAAVLHRHARSRAAAVLPPRPAPQLPGARRPPAVRGPAGRPRGPGRRDGAAPRPARLRRPVPAHVEPARQAPPRARTRGAHVGVHMRLSQELLHAETARRIGTARPDLAARLDLSCPAGLRAAQAEVSTPGAPGEVLATVVLRRLDLASWIRATC